MCEILEALLGLLYAFFKVYLESPLQFLLLVDQQLYYRILTIKLVNQKRNYNGNSRYD